MDPFNQAAPTNLDAVLQGATTDEVDVDFSGAVDFSPLRKGRYPAVIESVEPGVSGPNSKNPGAPKLVWKFVVIEGEYEGRVLFRHSPTTGKGAGLTKDVLRAIGVPGLDNPNIKFKMSTAVGQKVYLDVDFQKDNAKFNEITDVLPYAPAAPLAAL